MMVEGDVNRHQDCTRLQQECFVLQTNYNCQQNCSNDSLALNNVGQFVQHSLAMNNVDQPVVVDFCLEVGEHRTCVRIAVVASVARGSAVALPASCFDLVALEWCEKRTQWQRSKLPAHIHYIEMNLV